MLFQQGGALELSWNARLLNEQITLNRDIFVKANDDKMYLFGLQKRYDGDIPVVIFSLQDTVGKKEFLKPETQQGKTFISPENLGKIYLYKNNIFKSNYFYTTPTPDTLEDNYSDLVGEYILDDLYFGGTDFELVILARDKTSFKRLLKKEFTSRGSPFRSTKSYTAYHRVQKLEGGYLKFATFVDGCQPLGSSFGIFDIWAPKERKGKIKSDFDLF